MIACELCEGVGLDVKNRSSDLTKEQEGQDWPRKDIMNRHQAKALREGCHERKEGLDGCLLKREDEHQ